MNFKLYILSIISFLFSCKIVENSQKKQTELNLAELLEVKYKFNDSSVPPPFHRSYLIEANKKELKLKVDSYGDILVDTTFRFSEKQFSELKRVVSEAKFSKINRNKEILGCTGGTSEEITLNSTKEELLSGNFSYCGNVIAGDLKGDIKSVSKYLKSQIIDFNEYLK